MTAPECAGRVYRCTRCDDTTLRTLNESFRHSEQRHPETITTKSVHDDPATEARYNETVAELAALARALGR